MSLSDVSDLTDLSSDEDDEPLSKSTSRVKKAPKEYKMNHVLRPPRTTQYTARSLYDQIIDNSIDLDPDYQRDVVWQEEKQSGLIDSILRNYYIPPIIFAVTTQEDGSEMRTCIDGKQRLTSIQRFIDGQIPHKDAFTSERLWFKSSVGNARRKLLPQHLRTLFSNKQIVCVEYTGLNNDQEREIFQRVQLGVALTPAERLQALVGLRSTVIHEIQHQVLGEEGFEGCLDWGHARGRDFQCLATISYLIESHPKPFNSVPGARVLERWLQNTQEASSQLRADLHETFRIFVTLARDKKYSGSLNRPTRISPIEFVMIGLLIYLKRQSLSLTQISSAIEKMRKDVRAHHQDIRSNSRVTKHLAEFVTKKIKVSELKSDGEGDRPAVKALAKTAKLTKRKRPVSSDDSDSEPAPMKPAKKSSVLEATKSSKETSDAGIQKTKGTRKVSPSTPKASVTAKPLLASTTRRTNNSLANLTIASTPKPSLLTPAAQMSTHRSPPPVLSTSTGHDGHSGSTAPISAHGPLITTQTRFRVKQESPQISPLDSPAIIPMSDRLAPIRAAKATLDSGTVQSPMSQGGELRPAFNPVASTTQALVDPPHNYAAPPIVPPPPPSFQPTPQLPPMDAGEEHPPLPAQVEGVLRALRAQFPQLNISDQGAINGAMVPVAFRQDTHSPGVGGQPVMFSLVPVPGNNGGPSTSGQAFHGHVGPQRTYNWSFPNTHTNGYQGPRSSWPPSNSSIPGNVASPQTPTFPTPTSGGSVSLHALPPRPSIAPDAPTNNMRAEPLGPPSRPSSERAVPDGRRASWTNDPRDRGSYSNNRGYSNDRSNQRERGYNNDKGPYNNDRRSSRYPDDRRPSVHDRDRDSDRNKRPWPHYPRS